MQVPWVASLPTGECLAARRKASSPSDEGPRRIQPAGRGCKESSKNRATFDSCERKADLVLAAGSGGIDAGVYVFEAARCCYL